MLSGVIGWGRDASAVFYYSPFILTPPVLRIRIWYPGWEKIRIRYEHSRSFLRELLGLKILKFFDADPGSGIFLTLYPGWKKFGSGINISDVQHWTPLSFLPVPFFLILFSRLPYCMCMFSPWIFMFFLFILFFTQDFSFLSFSLHLCCGVRIIFFFFVNI